MSSNTAPVDSVSLESVVKELFSENVLAKVLRVATDALENNNPPTVYPEFVPQHGNDTSRYVLREKSFWTCGFFPGILYLLRERAVKYPQTFPYLHHENDTIPPRTITHLRSRLTSLSHAWTAPVQEMKTRTDTHDMAFIIQPSLRQDWELTSNPESLETVLTAAHSLASRFVPAAGAIRSWDTLRQADVQISSLTEDCLVIIDSMMNLDLLFYASKHLSDPGLAGIAITHARTIMRSHLRHETPQQPGQKYQPPALFSTYHVVNFDPRTGAIKQRRTAQGYAAESTWSRGQAWGIYGFAQTYSWTKEDGFLATACGLADYFLHRLETAPGCVEKRTGDGKGTRMVGRYVPLWDFDAPVEDEGSPLRDSSAGVIAANGLLILSQSLTTLGDAGLARRYLDAAVRIVSETIEYSYSREEARLVDVGGEVRVDDVVEGQRFDALLKNATANHNAQDHHRYSDHGLVYADYYLLEFGNRLLRMGLM
ncbi:glycoside hydrolase family 88 protein [Aspergillus lucknowensis]|uniref:Six-hairpin glycosidase-like protein n=1 Tax=Aspergillus lucknowensis TaxID=176173 RepID=A0ABR4LS98_9EURO